MSDLRSVAHAAQEEEEEVVVVEEEFVVVTLARCFIRYNVII